MRKVEKMPPQHRRTGGKYRELFDGSVWEIEAKDFAVDGAPPSLERLSRRIRRAAYEFGGVISCVKADGKLYVQFSAKEGT